MEIYRSGGTPNIFPVFSYKGFPKLSLDSDPANTMINEYHVMSKLNTQEMKNQ